MKDLRDLKDLTIHDVKQVDVPALKIDSINGFQVHFMLLRDGSAFEHKACCFFEALVLKHTLKRGSNTHMLKYRRGPTR